MALFGIFGRKSEESIIAKHGPRVANKRMQAQERWASIRALCELNSEDSIRALLKRFTFTTDPSISDQEEKDAICEHVVSAGDMSVAPLLELLRNPNLAISWPAKMLTLVSSKEFVTDSMLELLAEMHTDYERDPEKKIQTLAFLADLQDPRIGDAVKRFLEDVNESVRFRSVEALFAQEEVESFRTLLDDHLASEESMRIKAKVLDGFSKRSWSLSEKSRAVGLPTGYQVSADGSISRV